MAVVLLMEKDPFTELEASLEETSPLTNNVNVRRPVYGMLPKWAGDGEARFAYMSVLVDSGAGGVPQAISLMDSSAPGGFSDANHNFILQSVRESRQEKVQVIETFGDHFTFFYGEKPIIWQCSGMLFNTHDFNWKNEWLHNYENFLRGTRAVENRARIHLGVDDVVAEGYMLNTSVIYDKDMPMVCPFTFQLLLTKPPIDLSAGFDRVTEASQGRAISHFTIEDVTTEESAPSGRTFVEYLTALSDRGRFEVDPATGAIVQMKTPSANIPATLESTRSASHIVGTDPPWPGFKKDPIFTINAAIYAGQLGVDSTTAVNAVRRDPEGTQLGSRTDAVVASSAALVRGISNAAVVVPDAVPV